MLTPDQFDPGRIEALLEMGKVDEARAYREECLKKAAGDTAARAEITAKFDEISQRVTAAQAKQVVAPPPVSAPPSQPTSTSPSPPGPETSAKTPGPTTTPGEGESAAPPPSLAPDSADAATPAPQVKREPARPSAAVAEIKVPEVAHEPAGKESVGEPAPVTITPDQAGEIKTLKKLEPIQQAGLWLAAGVGSVIAVVTLIVLLKWIWSTPWTGVPPNLSGMTQQQAQQTVDNIKSLSDVASTRCLTIFDAIVTKALLPVFTSILGYIFGTRAAAAGSGGQSS